MSIATAQPRDALGRFMSAELAGDAVPEPALITHTADCGFGKCDVVYNSYADYVAAHAAAAIAENLEPFEPTEESLADACKRVGEAYSRLNDAPTDETPIQMDVAVIEGYLERASTRSFSSVVCKIWQWLRKAAEAIIETIADLLKFIGRAALDLLSDLVDEVTDWFDGDFLGGVLKVGALAGLFWLLFLRKKDGEEEDTDVNLVGYDGPPSRS